MEIDENGDGVISEEEFHKFLYGLEYFLSPEEV